jgi:hypothetical protein
MVYPPSKEMIGHLDIEAISGLCGFVFPLSLLPHHGTMGFSSAESKISISLACIEVLEFHTDNKLVVYP